jgi:hypothetical protein
MSLRAIAHACVSDQTGGKPKEEIGLDELNSGRQLLANKLIMVFVSSDTNSLKLRAYLVRVGAQVTTVTQRKDVLASLQEVEEGKGTPRPPAYLLSHTAWEAPLLTTVQHVAGQVDAIIADLPSLDKVQVYLLSQPRLIPLVVLALTSEVNSQKLRQMHDQYSPLRVVSLPLEDQVQSISTCRRLA